MLWREPKSIPTTDMGGYQQGRWVRVKERGGQGHRSCMLQPHLIFIWDLIKLSSTTSRFFASLPCPSTRVPITPGKQKSERGWSAPRTSRTLPCTKFSRKGRTQTSHPTLFPRYASRIHLRLVVQTMLSNSGQNEINVDDSSHAV